MRLKFRMWFKNALKGQKLSNTWQYTKLLPFQGALMIAIIPRALPWARSFCPFRACGAYLLNLSMRCSLLYEMLSFI